MKQLIIIGASGHGRVVADIARKNGYQDIAFLDDNPSVKECGGREVVGKSESFREYDCDFVVAIGNSAVRQRIQSLIEQAGKHLPALIHPNACVADGVSIGGGTVIAAGAVVNPGAVIGKGCIVNTGSSVDHDCVVEDYVHISVGAHVAGTVHVGERTWIGVGAAVSNNLNICADCMIGAGCVVVRDITESGTYMGVPAKRKP